MTEIKKRAASADGGAMPLGQDLLTGAGPIAEYTFGADNEPNRRRVYHAASKLGFPAFKMGAQQGGEDPLPKRLEQNHALAPRDHIRGWSGLVLGAATSNATIATSSASSLI